MKASCSPLLLIQFKHAIQQVHALNAEEAALIRDQGVVIPPATGDLIKHLQASKLSVGLMNTYAILETETCTPQLRSSPWQSGQAFGCEKKRRGQAEPERCKYKVAKPTQQQMRLMPSPFPLLIPALTCFTDLQATTLSTDHRPTGARLHGCRCAWVPGKPLYRSKKIRVDRTSTVIGGHSTASKSSKDCLTCYGI